MSDRTEPTNSDIMRELGALAEAMGTVKKELDRAGVSRGKLYEAVEATDRTVANLAFELEKTALVAAQGREEIRALRETLDPIAALKDDIPKMVETWRSLNKTSKRFIWFLGVGGTGIIAGVLWFGDVLREAILRWLSGGGPLPPSIPPT
jgi:hypothetical protein